MSFSYAVKVVKLIPMAVRLSAAGGAAYGSVKVGAWSPRTQDSKEKLDQLQREIQYPVAGKAVWRCLTFLSGYARLSLLQSASDRPLTSQLVEGWNNAVCTAFLTVRGDRGGLQLETLHSLKVGLKRWGSEIGKTVTGGNSDDKP